MNYTDYSTNSATASEFNIEAAPAAEASNNVWGTGFSGQQLAVAAGAGAASALLTVGIIAGVQYLLGRGTSEQDIRICLQLQADTDAFTALKMSSADVMSHQAKVLKIHGLTLDRYAEIIKAAAEQSKKDDKKKDDNKKKDPESK